MEWRLLSDMRVSVLFLLIILFFPIQTDTGLSIVALNIFNFNALMYGYLWLIPALVVAFIVSNVVFHFYDKNKLFNKKLKQKTERKV